MQSYPPSRDMLPLSAAGMDDTRNHYHHHSTHIDICLGEDLNTQPPVGRALTSYDDL